MLQTLEIEGLNIQGAIEDKPLIERIDNLDHQSEEYKDLLEQIVSKLVFDYDQFIENQISEKRAIYIQNIDKNVQALMINGYEQGWDNQVNNVYQL